ncbi:MAG: TRAP transporter large permease, partial [Pseudomonadota bacterium]
MGGVETLILVLALIFLGVPVAYAMFGASLLWGLVNGLPIGSMIMRAANSVDSATLLAIPAFIFASTLMNHGGITGRIFEFIKKSRIGTVKGGLAQVNVVASLIFSGMSGAALADIGGLGKVEIKAMRDGGYTTEDAAAITMASSIIGPIFPPSIPLLLYAVVAQVSGLQMLMAGIVPGIVVTLLLCIQVAFIARRNDWPTTLSQLSWRARFRVFIRAFPALMMPVLLVVGLLTGWYSPIELACLTVAYAFFLSAVLYRELTWRQLLATIAETIASSSSILLIAASASLFAWVITFEGVAGLVSDTMVGVTDNRYVLLLIVVVVLLIWGMVLDMLAAL